MKIKIPKVTGLKRLAFGAAALAVATASTLPSFMGHASAANLATSRYVKMSSSSITGSGVTYEIGFTTATTGATKGVVVDFCANSPIIGDTTCTAPTGFTVGTPTTSVSGTFSAAGSWTGGSLNSGRTLTVTNASNTSVAAGATAIITVTTVTNPTSAAATFYARIYTYDSAGGATGYTVANPSAGGGTMFDSGGVALATAAQINLTAKVQETLTFCVYTSSCGTGNSVSLGDTNGVLSTAGPFVDITTRYDIATNAASGATVRFKAGLPTSGSNTLASIGTTATSSSTGTTQFGLCTWQSSGSGLTAAAPYDNANCNTTSQTAGTGSTGGAGTAQFAFDTTPAATTFGDDLATKTAGTSSTGRIAFIGNTSATQAAGIYTNTFNFIATGTY